MKNRIFIVIIVIMNLFVFLDDFPIVSATQAPEWQTIESYTYPAYSPQITSTSGNTFSPKLSLFNGIPYIIWRDNIGSSAIHLVKWDNFRWTNIDGSAYSNTGSIIANYADQPCIAVTKRNEVIVVWKSFDKTLTDNTDIFCMRWNGSVWSSMSNEALGTDSINISKSHAFSDLPFLQLDPNDNPCITWRDGDDIKYARWNGILWTNIRGDAYQASNAIISANELSKGFSFFKMGQNGNIIFLWSEETKKNQNTNFRCVQWDGKEFRSTSGILLEDTASDESIVIRNAESFSCALLDIDSLERPYIVWTEKDKMELNFIRYKDGSWVNSLNQAYPMYSSLLRKFSFGFNLHGFKLDNNLNPLVLIGAYLGGDIILKIKNGSLFKVDDSLYTEGIWDIDGGFASDFVFDLRGNPHVVFQMNNYEIGYIKRIKTDPVEFEIPAIQPVEQGDIFEFEFTVESTSSEYKSTSIVLSTSGLPGHCAPIFDPNPAMPGQKVKMFLDTRCLDKGVYTFQLMASANNIPTSSRIVLFSVKPRECVKIEMITPKIYIRRGEEFPYQFEFQVKMKDDGGDEVKYSFNNSPDWVSFDPPYGITKNMVGTGVIIINGSKLPSGPKHLVTFNIMVEDSLCESRTIEIRILTNPEIIIDMWVGSKGYRNNSEPGNLSAPPYIKNGRTMIPIRDISEIFGCKIEWKSEVVENKRLLRIIITKNIGSNGPVIKLTIGDKTAYINDKIIILDAEPELVKETTMVPLKFIGDSFKADLKWENQTKHIKIIYRP